MKNGTVEDDSGLVPNLRHKLSLERSLRAVESAIDCYRRALPEELIAIDLKEAVDALSEVIGLAGKETVLDEIFTRFCIGK